MSSRTRRLGLRARVTAAFAVSALMLSVTLALLTFFLSRSYLLHQRENTAVRQAILNAKVVQDTLLEGADPNHVIPSLDRLLNSQSIVQLGARRYESAPLFAGPPVSASLQTEVARGVPVRQRFTRAGVPRISVGLPLPRVGASYFEIFSLIELKHTMGVLQESLAAAALATTLIGAGVGRWASGRLLRPLSDVSGAAAAVAAGDLDARVQTGLDRDLDVLATSFNQMTEALQRRIQRDARFASDVSHELRSPLTTLTTAVEVVRSRREELPERAKIALDLLVAELDRFEHLVQDLLEVSRFDAGAAELASDDVRMGEFVRHAVAAAGLDTVPVEVDAGVEELVVSVDKRRLERVLANLLDNARRHAGGAAAVRVERAPRSVRLAVEDRGPGVPSCDRERIFERFARGASAGGSDAGDGVGLGLALVAEHVRLHGGDTWVEDREGGGSRFVVDIPVGAS